MDRRIVILQGAAAETPSGLARQTIEYASDCDAVVITARSVDEAVEAVALATRSAMALACLVGPDVAQPLPTARRIARDFPALRFVFAVDPSREGALRREAIFGAPAGGRWALTAANDAGLRRLLIDALAASAQQLRLRTTLDRMKLRLAVPAPVDSTEYRRLIASDRYLASVLEHAHDAIVAVDTAGEIVSWNRGAEHLFGISAAQARRTPLAVLFETPPAFQAALDSALGDGPSRAEFSLRRDGALRYVDATFDRLVDDHGGAIGVGLVMRDTTERRRAEEALRNTGRQKDEFLAMLAHELRNPLAPIRNAAQILRLLRLADPRAQHATAIIARQVEHMTGLIDDLLDVARVTRGAVTLDREPLTLASSIADAVEQVRALIDARQHRLTVTHADESARVDGDRKRLTQVFANLLTNAAKYTPNGGEIALDVSVDAGQVRVAVSDNGAGMAGALVPRVFDLFAQGERGPDRAQGGLGVGLALVKTLIALHGGTVSAHSAGVGSGSRFVVSLPLLSTSAAAPLPQPAEPTAHSAGNRLNLMVVDDNADAAHTLAVLLEAHGHSVDVEVDSRLALQRAEAVVPDVFILDIGMPHIDGYELARRIRSSSIGSRAVLIALTGYGQPDDKIRARAAGFDHHLVKPLDPSVLTSLLEGMVPVVRH